MRRVLDGGERISAAHELKLDRYSELQVECQENGWSCYNMAVEVGARGVVAESLIKAAAAIGMRGRAQKKLVREVGMEACHCSKWRIGCVGRWSGIEGILRCEWVVNGLAALTREPLAGRVVNTGLFGWRFWIELGSF